MMTRSSLLSLAGLSAATLATALVSSRAGRSGRGRWYRRLRKPAYTPPRAAFPVAWTVLYALMTASAWRLSRAPASRARNVALGIWALQLALNGAWTPLFFARKRQWLAFGDLVALVAAISAYMLAARRVDRPAAWMMAPYLGWTSFAGVLNADIARRN